MIRNRIVKPGEASEAAQTAEAGNAQDYAGPAEPAVRPMPTVQPRRSKPRRRTTEDDYYLDPNDGTIKPEPVPEPPRPRTQPVTYQAPARDWD